MSSFIEGPLPSCSAQLLRNEDYAVLSGLCCFDTFCATVVVRTICAGLWNAASCTATQTHTDIQEVFADLAVLVDTQDEQIDLVEENVDQVVTMTEEAGEELMAAERYQKSNRKRTLGLFLVVLVLVILLLVIIIRGQDDG